MNFNEIVQLAHKIESEIIKDPEKSFLNFKAQWLVLDFEERRLIAPGIIDFCTLKLGSDNYIPQNINSAEQKICCTGIINFITDGFNGRPSFGTLDLADGINQVDIATVFKLLIDIGYITNTDDETARVMTRVFGFNQDFKRYSYFQDDIKLIQSALKFKRKIDNSNLLRGQNK